MKNAAVWVLKTLMLTAFFMPVIVNAQSAGIIIGQQFNASVQVSIDGHAIMSSVATSSTGFAGANPSYLHLMLDNKNHDFGFDVGGNATDVVYYADTGCTQVSNTYPIVPYTDPAQTGVHDVYLDLTGDITATSGVKCIAVPNWNNGYYTGAGQTTGAASAGYPVNAFYELASTFVPFPAGSFFATTGLAPTSTSIFGTSASSSIACDNSGNDLVWVACTAASYLFVPSTGVVNEISSLQPELQTKFPFSWYFAIQGTFRSLTASSTSNMADVQINFASMDPSSSTAMGPILPNMVILSSTTITTYLTPSILALLLSLESLALWIIFGFYIYHEVSHGWVEQ